jgi:Family of unknown function (DUF6065)
MTRMPAAGGPDAPEDEPSATADQPFLLALQINPGSAVPQAAPVRRDWMDSSGDRFAYRCLPLLLGNQAGWVIASTCTAHVHWTGDAGRDALTITTDVEFSPVHPVSHFGGGILTWSIPYLFRTAPGFNLLVRGPSNCPKDAVYPLDGIVETDWAPVTFTMNWIMTRPHHTVTFAAGEPICMIVPQKRGELEDVRTEFASISDAPETERRYRTWFRSRTAFISALANRDDAAVEKGWERDYFLGRDSDGLTAPEHQMRMRLRAFQEKR